MKLQTGVHVRNELSPFLCVPSAAVVNDHDIFSWAICDIISIGNKDAIFVHIKISQENSIALHLICTTVFTRKTCILSHRHSGVKNSVMIV